MRRLFAHRWAARGHAVLVRELEWSRALMVETPWQATEAAPSVSSWSTLEHLEHLTRVGDAILTWLLAVRSGAATSDGGRPSPAGYAVLASGRIPRGRAQAPGVVRPVGADARDVAGAFDRLVSVARELAPAVDRLASSRVTRRHPVLGCLTPAEWLRFAALHQRHHRRIIDDIHAHAGTEGHRQ